MYNPLFEEKGCPGIYNIPVYRAESPVDGDLTVFLRHKDFVNFKQDTF